MAAGFIGGSEGARWTPIPGARWTVRGVEPVADPADAQIVAGDVTEPGEWVDGLVGADLVIHTAALVSNAAALADGWRVNVGGTRRVVEAAAAAGVGRLVHFSSAAVYGHHRAGRVDEHEPVRLSGAVYGDTKIASEQVVLQAHAAGEISATIVRPSDVYGPGSRPWTILPVQMLRARQVLLPAHGTGSFVPVYVDDLVDGVVAAAPPPPPPPPPPHPPPPPPPPRVIFPLMSFSHCRAERGAGWPFGRSRGPWAPGPSATLPVLAGPPDAASIRWVSHRRRVMRRCPRRRERGHRASLAVVRPAGVTRHRSPAALLGWSGLRPRRGQSDENRGRVAGRGTSDR